MCKAVTGKAKTKRGGGLKLCPVFELIRQSLEEACAPAEKPCVLEAESLDESEPMRAMDIVQISASCPNERRTGAHATSKNWKRQKIIKKLTSQVIELQVPEHSPLEKRRGGGKRSISVYATKHDARCFWLHTDDVEWFVNVMCREYDLRGVAVLDDTEAAPSGHAVGQQAPSDDPGAASLPNGSGASSSSADVVPAQSTDAIKIGWNFQVDCWEACVYGAAGAEPTKLFCRPQDLTPAKVAQLGSTPLESMTPQQRKNAAKQYLQLKTTELVSAAAGRRPVARPLTPSRQS